MNAPIEAAEALVIYPGDTLVVRVHPGYSRAEHDEFGALIRKQLTPDVQVLIIGAEQLAVIRSTP